MEMTISGGGAGWPLMAAATGRGPQPPTPSWRDRVISGNALRRDFEDAADCEQDGLEAREGTIFMEDVPTVARVETDGALVPALVPQDFGTVTGSVMQHGSVQHGTVSGAWKMAPVGDSRAPRIIDRDGNSRSNGRTMIRRRTDSVRNMANLKDAFHSLVYLATWKVLAIACSAVFLSWVLFAGLFLLVSRDCGLEANTFLRAFYLSLETVETIGYGVPDPYFKDCKSGLAVMVGAALWESVLNAAIIAVIYTRISRPQGRALSISFTDKAIIAEIDGHIYFMLQAVDVRKHQLVESHARMYSVEHAESDRGVCFQTRVMRLQHPDDDMGGMMLLMLPQMIVHRVDEWSPLWPWPHRDPGQSPAGGFRFPDVVQRGADAENGNRDGGPPRERRKPTLADVADRFQTGQLEVIVLIEGIEPITSMTMQARQSYTCDDVVFNAAFQRCVRRAPDGMCEFNFDAFHELVEMPPSQSMVVQGMA